jgi:hypothetical protein
MPNWMEILWRKFENVARRQGCLSAEMAWAEGIEFLMRKSRSRMRNLAVCMRKAHPF